MHVKPSLAKLKLCIENLGRPEEPENAGLHMPHIIVMLGRTDMEHVPGHIVCRNPAYLAAD